MFYCVVGWIFGGIATTNSPPCIITGRKNSLRGPECLRDYLQTFNYLPFFSIKAGSLRKLYENSSRAIDLLFNTKASSRFDDR